MGLYNRRTTGLSLKGKTVIIILCHLFVTTSGHHVGEPWRFYHHGIFRAFFSGFFSTLLLIIGVLVFYYYCLRGGAMGKYFPMFPKKPMIPITIPFARAPHFMDMDRPETIVLTSTTTPPSVFYSNVHSADSPAKGGYSGYNIL